MAENLCKTTYVEFAHAAIGIWAIEPLRSVRWTGGCAEAQGRLTLRRRRLGQAAPRQAPSPEGDRPGLWPGNAQLFYLSY